MILVLHTLDNSVKDIMKHQVVTVNSAMSVMDTAKIMDDAGIGCVVVIENNIAVGIVTERDFVKRVAARGIPMTTPIKQVMSSPLIVVNPEENIWEVAELMKQRKIHKVPVVHQRCDDRPGLDRHVGGRSGAGAQQQRRSESPFDILTHLIPLHRRATMTNSWIKY